MRVGHYLSFFLYLRFLFLLLTAFLPFRFHSFLTLRDGRLLIFFLFLCLGTLRIAFFFFLRFILRLDVGLCDPTVGCDGWASS